MLTRRPASESVREEGRHVVVSLPGGRGRSGREGGAVWVAPSSLCDAPPAKPVVSPTKVHLPAAEPRPTSPQS